jgi:soluble lytic murein transglycosylase
MRTFLILLMLSGVAQAQEVLDFVRVDRWPEAAAAAARVGDPIAGKLVTYYRLQSPGAGGAAEIAAFMAENPDWPAQAMLARRRDEALAGESDEVARGLCKQAMPALAGALQRCAEATGDAAFARAAWASGFADVGWEIRFAQRWGSALTAETEQARFERLLGTDTAAARRQVARLGGAARAVAAARLALRVDDPGAAGLLAAAARGDAGLLLDEARWLRRGGDDAGALALWLKAGAAGQGGTWAERNLLARRLLRAGDAKGAYAVAAGFVEGPGEDVLDAQFLAGFVALRMLDDRAAARRHFQVLAERSGAVITQGRAYYWLGRAAADPAAAKAAYEKAAGFGSSFYGQLAALALTPNPELLTARIATMRDPPADQARLQALAVREMARAAALLGRWGDRRRAQVFLLRLDETLPDPGDRTLAARLADEMGMVETAVAISRRAGRDGVALIEAGWPVPVSVPAGSGVETPLALGIMRQESNFDTAVISRAGARGLMQLMPATAAQVGKRLGIPVSVPALTVDTSTNMRLGTAYLAEMMERFDGCTPLAVAAYNAGPGRVREWLGSNGDPRTKEVDMLDWIELIPIAETRNYVQRVIENEVIYRAKAGVVAAHPLAPWLR